MGIRRAAHFSTISALALAALRWITRGTNFDTNSYSNSSRLMSTPAALAAATQSSDSSSSVLYWNP